MLFSQLGLDIEDLEENEADAGLGNGGQLLLKLKYFQLKVTVHYSQCIDLCFIMRFTN